MIGRFQPFHEGHYTLMLRGLDLYGQVIIGIRNTYGLTEKDPFPPEKVMSLIEQYLDGRFPHGEWRNVVRIVILPNIASVIYGRDVGYKIEKIDLPADIEAISATQIRSTMETLPQK